MHNIAIAQAHCALAFVTTLRLTRLAVESFVIPQPAAKAAGLLIAPAPRPSSVLARAAEQSLALRLSHVATPGGRLEAEEQSKGHRAEAATGRPWA